MKINIAGISLWALQTIVLLVCFVGPAVSGDQLAPSAGTVIYVAREIVTMDPGRARVEAVVVSGDRITAVGGLEEMKALAGEGAVVDKTFVDKVIVPGLIEQHIHPVLSALTLTSHVISIEEWVLPEQTFPAARNRTEYFARLSQAEAEKKDPAEPLVSWGFHHYFHGKLTRADLDNISSERPIIIWHRSAHEFILNTAALRATGVTQEQLAMQPAVIRNQVNLEDGHFWEKGAFDFLLPKIMPFTASPAQLKAGLELTERYLQSAGVTTSAEPGGMSGMYAPQVAVLGDTATPFRFYFIVDGRTLADKYPSSELIAETEKIQTGAQGHTAFLPKQVKLFMDGAIFSQLMQMQDGYLDKHEGEWLMEKDVYTEAFRTYWDAGYQIHIHQNGDAGLERVLDVLEDNLKRNPRADHRTTIVHFGFSTPEQVSRIAELGAIVSANPYYTVALADQYGTFGVGPERADDMVRLGDVAKAGISISLHSDMPMAPAQPLFLMWAAVNRTTSSGRVAGPEQRLGVEEALKAVTINAAYSLRLEQDIGSITPGKLANFTILENSPFEVDPASIKDIGIWGTVLEGRVQPL